MVELPEGILGKDATIYEPVIIGFPLKGIFNGVSIGDNALLRTGTVIYHNVTIGNNFSCGHNVMIRENTTIGNNVMVGTGSIIEGDVRIEDNTRIQSDVFISKHTIIKKRVFLGPRVTLLNDLYPPSPLLKGPYIMDDAIVGASATILPGIIVNKHAFVAAGALVTKNVPEGMMAMGVPAKMHPMPRKMKRVTTL